MKRVKAILSESRLAAVWAVVWNLVLVYVTYALARVLYLAENWSLLSGALDGGVSSLLQGAWMFDTSAIIYTNVLWILLMLLPLHVKENEVYHRVCRWIFVIVNAMALIINLCDAVYFPFTMRRTTSTVFGEFSHEGNLFSIFVTEALRHWYLLLVAIILIYGLWKLYLSPRLDRRKLVWWRYDLMMLVSLVVAAPLCVAGMRGGFTTAVRPITVSNAAQYVTRPTDAALVLNTPFSLIRTIG